MFVSKPIWCTVSYSISVDDPSASNAFTFDADPTKRIFTFNNVDDLSLAGSSSTNYTISVTGKVGNSIIRQATSSFNLRIKNPCIDPNYVTISPEPLPTGLTYDLYAFNRVKGYKFTHMMNEVATVPFTHDLCGSIEYIAFFLNQELDS